MSAVTPQVEDKVKKAASDAAAANSIPVLRQVVADLANEVIKIREELDNLIEKGNS